MRPATTRALEQRVIDLWEQGLSKQMIADALDVPLKTVDRVMGYMLDRNEQRLAEQAMRHGSEALAKAINAARVQA